MSILQIISTVVLLALGLMVFVPVPSRMTQIANKAKNGLLRKLIVFVIAAWTAFRKAFFQGMWLFFTRNRLGLPFKYNDKRIFWKVDCYAPDMLHESKVPDVG